MCDAKRYFLQLKIYSFCSIPLTIFLVLFPFFLNSSLLSVHLSVYLHNSMVPSIQLYFHAKRKYFSSLAVQKQFFPRSSQKIKRTKTKCCCCCFNEFSLESRSLCTVNLVRSFQCPQLPLVTQTATKQQPCRTAYIVYSLDFSCIHFGLRPSPRKPLHFQLNPIPIPFQFSTV